MNILLTNDDGINGEGLVYLKEALRKLDDYTVFVVAPEFEKSACSHQITVSEPLILKQLDDHVYTLNGSPADCVKISLNSFLKGEIDLVVSGINDGPNMGIDTFYSGTVAGAREACFHQIPSIAFSIDGFLQKKCFDSATYYALEIIQKVVKQKLPKNILLNVNFPNVKKELINGIQITSLGKRIYRDQVLESETPYGWKCFWIGGDTPTYHFKEESDFMAVENSYISLTPLQLDTTSYKLIDELKNWDF